MAHFAKLDENNIVLEVNVVNNSDIGDLPFPESEPAGIAFLDAWAGEKFKWKQTSYNGSFRVRYGLVGYKYDEQLDAFIPPKPFPSWVFNSTTYDYDPPIPRPGFEYEYVWNEAIVNWERV